MIKISHRGNVSGRKPEKENLPIQIFNAIEKGFNVEIDVRFYNNKFYFGHDYPQYEVSENLILELKKFSWFHCKDFESLYLFNKNFVNFKYFWHESDQYTLTSNHIIWTYPNHIISDKSIIVNLGKVDISKFTTLPYGICTDYPESIRI